MRRCFVSTTISRIVGSFLCLSIATGCTTFKPVAHSDAQSAISRIKPGDEVRLTTRNGMVRELKVKETTGQQLVGENEKVDISDVTDIERREFSTGKNIALVVVSILVIGLLTASASGGWSKGP